MGSTVTGDEAPEEKPEASVSEEVSTAENPPPAKPAKKQNWTLIALIAVSCVALLLLASTITLAVVGDFGHQKGGFRLEGPGDRPPGPMWGPNGDRLRNRPNRQWNNQDNQDQQTPPSDKQQSDKQKSETQPGQTAPETRADPRLGLAS